MDSVALGQMRFTKYLVVVDDDVDVRNTSEVLFRLCATVRQTSPTATRLRPIRFVRVEAVGMASEL